MYRSDIPFSILYILNHQIIQCSTVHVHYYCICKSSTVLFNVHVHYSTVNYCTCKCNQLHVHVNIHLLHVVFFSHLGGMYG